jgi:hypothetical protein
MKRVYKFAVVFEIESTSKEEARYNFESWRRGLESHDFPMEAVRTTFHDVEQLEVLKSEL